MTKEDEKDKTGKRIKKTIKERGMRQPEVADRVGISKSYLHNIKAGIMGAPAKTLARIARVIGTSAEYLKRGKK